MPYREDAEIDNEDEDDEEEVAEWKARHVSMEMPSDDVNEDREDEELDGDYETGDVNGWYGLHQEDEGNMDRLYYSTDSAILERGYGVHFVEDKEVHQGISLDTLAWYSAL